MEYQSSMAYQGAGTTGSEEVHTAMLHQRRETIKENLKEKEKQRNIKLSRTSPAPSEARICQYIRGGDGQY